MMVLTARYTRMLALAGLLVPAPSIGQAPDEAARAAAFSVEQALQLQRLKLAQDSVARARSARQRTAAADSLAVPAPPATAEPAPTARADIRALWPATARAPRASSLGEAPVEILPRTGASGADAKRAPDPWSVLGLLLLLGSLALIGVAAFGRAPRLNWVARPGGGRHGRPSRFVSRDASRLAERLRARGAP